VEKLVSPEYMGERFLYLCVQNSNNKNTPAGFSSPYEIETKNDRTD
jgi:SAM-dependent MidA family methyltransferase